MQAPGLDHMLQPGEIDAALGNSRLVSLFETRNPDRAKAYLSDVYGPHALLLAGERALDMRLRGGEIAQLHLGELRYGTQARVASGRAPGYWVFSYVQHGEVRRTYERLNFAAGDAGVTAPGDVQSLEMSADMELVNLRVAHADMVDACRSLLGSDLTQALRFEPRSAAGAPAAAALLRVLSHLAATPPYPHVAAARLERSLRDAALYELLLAWPNSCTRCLDAPPALPASTRRARDYIHAEAASVPSVAEIARAAGVGVRSLARAFDRHLGMSPQRYVLQVRLDGARAQLRAAALGCRGAVTVTDVAAQWGFWQLGAFAARYRERFGEPPSRTLYGTQRRSDLARSGSDTP
ncbi:AraC family transcriptional regulator [Roseateles sp.]|uniref:AraC family transcriptional regulator n=1 Tax=Roseateles sp. TaxID=1971397 RepID=UPI0039E844E9